jgi:hypothetical protein
LNKMIDHHQVPVAETRRADRLLLRLPKADDLPFLTELFAKPELVAHRPVPRPDSPEECAARLARDRAHWKEHGFGRWAVIANENLIGFGGVTVSKEFDGLNLSYHLDPQSWGNGYATELGTRERILRFQRSRSPSNYWACTIGKSRIPESSGKIRLQLRKGGHASWRAHQSLQPYTVEFLDSL